MVKILVIEDSPVDCNILCYILTKNNFSVKCFDNSEEGLKYLIYSRFNVDVIISDIKMDGKSGLDFKRELNNYNSGKKIPFIFLTSDSSIKSQKEAKELEAELFLLKPFDKINIPDIIRNIVPIKK